MVRALVLMISLLFLPMVSLAKAESASDTTAKSAAEAGVWQFKAAIEHLGQSLYRFGLTAPDRHQVIMLPILRMPVPVNLHPEKVTYAAFRQILETLVVDLDASESSMAKLGDVDFKMPIDLACIHFDFDQDGKTGAAETLPAVLAGLMLPSDTAPLPKLNVHFDTADIYWLRGYGRFISSFAQFLLAHDFEKSFNSTAHMFFPHSGLALGEKLNANRTTAPFADAEIGDLIALLHLVSWPVVEPERLANVRVRLVAMSVLSPLSWAAARRETDNDLEWMPNAKQTDSMTGATNSDEQINTWIAVMAEFGDVLEGKKLLPHWRFDKGLNVKRFFESSRYFDLVLMVTGTDAVTYLEDGSVSSSSRWNNLMGAFEGNFLGYALWYN
jgi:hypothetical protein